MGWWGTTRWAPLAAALQSEDPEVRALAAIGLSHTRDPRATSALVAALEDGSVKVRSAARAACRRSSDFAQRRAVSELAMHEVEALIVALDDRAAAVRFWAAKALGNARSPAGIAPLTHALGDSHAERAGGGRRARSAS